MQRIQAVGIVVAVAIAVGIVGLTISYSTPTAHALAAPSCKPGTQPADAQCSSAYDYTCKFGTPASQCPQKKPGGLGMPCGEPGGASGQTVSGTCACQQACKASESGGKPPELPSPPSPSPDSPESSPSSTPELTPATPLTADTGQTTGQVTETPETPLQVTPVSQELTPEPAAQGSLGQDQQPAESSLSDPQVVQTLVAPEGPEGGEVQSTAESGPDPENSTNGPAAAGTFEASPEPQAAPPQQDTTLGSVSQVGSAVSSAVDAAQTVMSDAVSAVSNEWDTLTGNAASGLTTETGSIQEGSTQPSDEGAAPSVADPQTTEQPSGAMQEPVADQGSAQTVQDAQTQQQTEQPAIDQPATQVAPTAEQQLLNDVSPGLGNTVADFVQTTDQEITKLFSNIFSFL